MGKLLSSRTSPKKAAAARLNARKPRVRKKGTWVKFKLKFPSETGQPEEFFETKSMWISVPGTPSDPNWDERAKDKAKAKALKFIATNLPIQGAENMEIASFQVVSARGRAQ